MKAVRQEAAGEQRKIHQVKASSSEQRRKLVSPQQDSAREQESWERGTHAADAISQYTLKDDKRIIGTFCTNIFVNLDEFLEKHNIKNSPTKAFQ